MNLDLYTIEKNLIPKTVVVNGNKHKSWKYGYNEKYDVVVISKDGTLGEVYNIQGFKVGLPLAPNGLKTGANKWEIQDIPETLIKIRSIFEWKQKR